MVPMIFVYFKVQKRQEASKNIYSWNKHWDSVLLTDGTAHPLLR